MLKISEQLSYPSTLTIFYTVLIKSLCSSISLSSRSSSKNPVPISTPTSKNIHHHHPQLPQTPISTMRHEKRSFVSQQQILRSVPKKKAPTQNNIIASTTRNTPPRIQDPYNDFLRRIRVLEDQAQQFALATAQALQPLRSVGIDPAAYQNLMETKQQIQQLIQKQARKQLDALNAAEKQKLRQQVVEQQYHKALGILRKEVPVLRNENEKHIRKMQQLRILQETEKELLTHFENCTVDRAKLTIAVRESQEKMLKQKQELNDLSNELFRMNEASDQQLREEQDHKENAMRVTMMEKLMQKRNRVMKETEERLLQYQELSKSRIDEILNLRQNNAKITDRINQLDADLYEQKAFLRAGQMERGVATYANNDDDESDQQRVSGDEQQYYQPKKRPTREQLQKYYHEQYLPVLPNRYSGRLAASSSPTYDLGTPQLKDFSSKMRLRTNSGESNNKSYQLSRRSYVQQDDSSNYDSAKSSANRAIRKEQLPQIHRPPTMSVIRSRLKTLPPYAQDYRKPTTQKKSETPKQKQKDPTLELLTLYEKNNQRLKQQIKDKLKQKNPGTRVTTTTDDMELVSVSEGDDDSRYDYVEVEVNKEALVGTGDKRKS